MSPVDQPPEPGQIPAQRQPTERLDQRVVVYWYFRGLTNLIVPCGLLLVGVFVANYQWSEKSPGLFNLSWALAAALAGFLIAVALISPALAYKFWRFSVDDEMMLTRHGILFIEEKFIPISRLQHVDLYRGPVERMFGLATLVVFTAGTEGAHFSLPGLAVGRAQQLRDQILAARGDDVI